MIRGSRLVPGVDLDDSAALLELMERGRSCSCSAVSSLSASRWRRPAAPRASLLSRTPMAAEMDSPLPQIPLNPASSRAILPPEAIPSLASTIIGVQI